MFGGRVLVVAVVVGARVERPWVPPGGANEDEGGPGGKPSSPNAKRLAKGSSSVPPNVGVVLEVDRISDGVACSACGMVLESWILSISSSKSLRVALFVCAETDGAPPACRVKEIGRAHV